MGTFYGNVLVGRSCKEVVPLLAGADIRGYALPVGPAHTVICPADEPGAIELAGTVSRLLGGPALGTYVFDSDVLVMQVYEGGELRHVYDSYPGYFQGDHDLEEVEEDLDRYTEVGWPDPVGADPDAFLPLAAHAVDLAALASVLHSVPLNPEDGEDGRYVFANAQHYDVMRLLGLDALRLSTGFGEISRGFLPTGTAPDDLWLLGGVSFGAVGEGADAAGA